jgi:peptidoglycan-associated lipoprotein
MKRAMLIALIGAFALLLAAATACRRDIDDDGADTLTVIGDTVPVGMWDTDTLHTGLQGLDLFQQNMRDVFFEYDSSDLTQMAMDALMFDAAYVMANTGFKLLVEGHCDERGTIDYNLALGERRAVAAYQYLVDYGVDPSRLQYVSYGKERPLIDGHDEVSWAQNRRAHMRVLPE